MHFAESEVAVPLDIAGASPETMARYENGRVTLLWPIAGTRPRGKDAADDARLEAELLADPKERAEHVMLVDLARNDVGRVAKPGTVQITQEMKVERFSHVMHIVSEVTGEVRADATPADVLASAFPAGTLSGAPKVRAMQIIRELEGGARNHSGGGIGYFMPGGEFDVAIAIRTVVAFSRANTSSWPAPASSKAATPPRRPRRRATRPKPASPRSRPRKTPTSARSPKTKRRPSAKPKPPRRPPQRRDPHSPSPPSPARRGEGGAPSREDQFPLSRVRLGSPPRSPGVGPHRSGRAGFPHPAPQDGG